MLIHDEDSVTLSVPHAHARPGIEKSSLRIVNPSFVNSEAELLAADIIVIPDPCGPPPPRNLFADVLIHHARRSQWVIQIATVLRKPSIGRDGMSRMLVGIEMVPSAGFRWCMGAM